MHRAAAAAALTLFSGQVEGGDAALLHRPHVVVAEILDDRNHGIAVASQNVLELGLRSVEQQDFAGGCRILRQSYPGLEDKLLVAGIVQQQRLHLQGFIQDCPVDMRKILLRLDSDQLLDIGRRPPGKGNNQRDRNGRG